MFRVGVKMHLRCGEGGRIIKDRNRDNLSSSRAGSRPSFTHRDEWERRTSCLASVSDKPEKEVKIIHANKWKHLKAQSSFGLNYRYSTVVAPERSTFLPQKVNMEEVRNKLPSVYLIAQ